MIGEIFRWVLGTEDAGAALAMLWSAMKITTEFGFRSRREVWALMRRFFYYCMSAALMYLGLRRFSGLFPDPSIWQFLAGSAIAIGIIVFPIMRALGLITQDELLLSEGSGDGDEPH